MWSKCISCEGVYINCETVKYIDAKQVSGENWVTQSKSSMLTRTLCRSRIVECI